MCVPVSNPCEGVTCGGNGSCAVRGGEAVCVCNAGFSLMGTTMCVPSAGGPCEGVTCSAQGQCAVVNDAARCLCNPGFVANGTSCEPGAASPCNGVTCSGHGTCAVTTANQPRCFCDAGYVSGGATSCVMAPANPCMGVTCGGNGTCAVANNLPLCVCNANYQPSGNLLCARTDDPCAGVDCLGQGTCAVANDVPVCTCNNGFRLQPGSSTRCVPTQKTLSFLTSSVTVLEDARSVTVPVVLSEPPSSNVTLTSTRSGTATSGSDFMALPATFTLVPNLTSQALAVSITNDLMTEGDETLILTLTAPAGWALGPHPTLTITILDDESANYGPRVCRQFGGDGDDGVNSLLVDAQDRVYLGGKTDGTLFAPQGFNPGNSMHTGGGGGYGDNFVASYDLDGGSRWGVQWGNFHRESVGTMKLDPSGQALFITSNFSNSDVQVRKLNAADGGLVWTHTFADAGGFTTFAPALQRPRSLELDPSGRVVIASMTTKSIDGQPFRGGNDLVVSSIAPDGQSRWTRLVGSNGTDVIGGLALDGMGNVYVCGTVPASIDQQPYGGGLCGGFNSCGNQVADPVPCTDGVLVKFSPTGQRLWTRQWGSDRNETCGQLRITSQGVLLAFGLNDGVPTLTRFDRNGNRLGAVSNPRFEGSFFLDAQDHVYFGDVGLLTKFDATGTTVLQSRHLLQPGQFVGISDFILRPNGGLLIAGAGNNYCNAPSPPGTQNNAYWAIYDP
jgi:hypothetical protein